MTVYCLMWNDDWCVIDGSCPNFLQSIHRTKRGALKERARLNKLRHRNSSNKFTTRYTIQAWESQP